MAFLFTFSCEYNYSLNAVERTFKSASGLQTLIKNLCRWSSVQDIKDRGKQPSPKEGEARSPARGVPWSLPLSSGPLTTRYSMEPQGSKECSLRSMAPNTGLLLRMHFLVSAILDACT